MKKNKLLLLFLLLGYTSLISAQNLFTLGNEKHDISEFNYAFKKNNSIKNIKKDSINAYLNLYINFKLKVKEAKKLGYDSAKEFKREFNLYKTQLENTYLTPQKKEESLIKEAYERSKLQINASHILIRLSENAPPADTLEAYQKIISIRKKALDGEPFSELAKEKSEDLSAKKNGGALGYFSVFQMIYPFESAAYNTVAGEISKPIRTKFGYHIIKVIDKRATKGKVKVAHIMIRSNQKNAIDFQKKAREKIFMIDSLLKTGKSWNKLCKKYSEDDSSIQHNGELMPFGRGQIIPSFEKAAFLLTNVNDISAPVQTQFGWHIIKLIQKIPLGTYEEEKPKLENKIKSSDRASMPRNEMLKKLKLENNFYRNELEINKLLSMPTSIIKNGQWNFDSNHLTDTTVLFSIDKIKISSGRFLSSIQTKPFETRLGAKKQIKKELRNYEDSLIISYEKQNLSKKYPEYSLLIQEYYDGILLFSIMEDFVWKRPTEKSPNLTQYYENHKNNYAKITKDSILFSSNSKSALVKLKKTIPDKQPISNWHTLKSKFLKENETNPLTFQVILEDAEIWKKWKNKKHNKPIKLNEKWYLFKPTKLINYPPLENIKGKVLSDYQQYLDANWVKKLKKKYPVNINKKSLKKVYEHFKATK